jgi:hypothetical protein
VGRERDAVLLPDDLDVELREPPVERERDCDPRDEEERLLELLVELRPELDPPLDDEEPRVLRLDVDPERDDAAPRLLRLEAELPRSDEPPLRVDDEPPLRLELVREEDPPLRLDPDPLRERDDVCLLELLPERREDEPEDRRVVPLDLGSVS